MCGICGLIAKDPISPEHRRSVRQMNDALSHRGPDGEGYLKDEPHVAMAMRRLSIIDLQGGWQPIYNEDRSLAVTCNGEIYNYIELRASLETAGHRYTTDSDVENILHLYEDLGLDFVHKLRGMFAISLWDQNLNRLILVRDRMGEKPLYLYEQPGSLFYASELKALIKSGVAQLELDPVAVDQYFHFQYVPEPATPIKGIRKLPAGHMLVIDMHPWQVDQRCYWRMEDAEPIEDDPAARLRRELDQVHKIVIRSDVPVGVALSGGIDSSLVAGLAHKSYPGTLQAFSVGYAGGGVMDERSAARELATHLKLPFHEVELNMDEMVAFFPDLVHWRDDPIADIAGHGYFAVQRAASQAGVPVMLQGQGGDELFWGYDWVRAALAEMKIRQNLSLSNIQKLAASLTLIPPTGLSRAGLGPFLRTLGGVYSSWQRYRRITKRPPEAPIFYELSPDYALTVTSISRYYSAFQRSSVNGYSPQRGFLSDNGSNIEVLLTKLISQSFLLENGVAQGDRLGMASSVELRLPLLDYQFVETVVGLRKAQPDGHLPPKTWLRDAAKGILPDWVLDRPKRGFEPPVRLWHRALFEKYGGLLLDGQLVQRDILSAEGARHLGSGIFPKFNRVPLSFKALVFEVWLRQLDNDFT